MTIDPEVNRFLEHLPLRRKVTQEMIWEAVKAAFPGQGTAIDWRAKIRDLLARLVEAGKIGMPKGRGFYTGAPPLPVWVTRLDFERRKVERVEGHIWCQELSFLASESLEADNEWLVIDRWIKSERRGSNMVPIRERSLDIFGDEKKLDGFLTRRPFKSGIITLEALRCFYVPVPIAWHPGPPDASGPGIVIENANTYASIRTYNDRVGRYAYVAYGSGNAFTSTQEGAAAVAENYGHCQILYFGDIDWDGVNTPSIAAARLREKGIMLMLDSWLYRLLLDRGKGFTKLDAKRSNYISKEMVNLLPPECAAEIEEILLNGRRLPQELVGTTMLSNCNESK